MIIKRIEDKEPGEKAVNSSIEDSASGSDSSSTKQEGEENE